MFQTKQLTDTPYEIVFTKNNTEEKETDKWDLLITGFRMIKLVKVAGTVLNKLIFSQLHSH